MVLIHFAFPTSYAFAMRSMLVLAVVFGAASGWAGKKTVVVGAGDCKDGAVLSATKDFQDLARPMLKSDLFEPEGVLRAVRLQANRSMEDIQRQVDTARSQLYAGSNERGLESVQDALTDLERVSPQVKPWPLTISALVLQAQMLKNLERTKESAEAFRRILRVEPTFKLDPDSYPPSTIAALEQVRKEVQRAKKGLLQVVSTPSGAQVFIDGREVGKTPFKGEVMQGQYRVSLMAGEAVSFPHKVSVAREESLQIDMSFEGAVALQPPLCVTGFIDDSAGISLASTVAAEQVVVVRNTAIKGNPPYISGTLYDVARGERIRNAGVRPEQLKDLMLYLFTGKPDITTAPLPPAAPPVAADAPKKDGRKTEPRAETSHSGSEVDTQHVVSAVPEGAQVSTARIVSYVTLGVGVAIGAVGFIVFTGGADDRATLEALKTPTGKLPDPVTAATENAHARSLLGSVTSNQIVAFSLIGIGAGAIVSGVVGMLLFPGHTNSLALVPTRDGAAVAFSGAF